MCALRGSGRAGRPDLDPLPTSPAPRLQGAPARQVEDVEEDLTPVQRFERAMKRRDAATPKPPSPPGKADEPAG